MEFKHKSVLLEETIEGLDIKPDGIYVDGTLGGAGHAGEVCRKLSAKGRFIGIDQDQDAIIAASERLAPYKQATIIRSNYCYMVQELAARGIYKVDGILLDLGVSSYQLDNEERGFTYRVDAPLDMRMDQRQTQTAGDIVKTIFRKNENPCTCPSDFPVCVCGKKSKGKVITRKPILPGETEMEENPRSKSAKLRIFERVL